MTRIVLVAVLALSLTGCKKQQNTVSQEVQEPTTPEMDRGVDVEERSGWIGVVTAKDQQEIVAPFATTVKEYVVGVGAVVNKGDKVAILDDEPLREQVAKSLADLQGAQASAAKAANEVGSQRKLFKAGIAAKAAVTQAEYASSEASSRASSARAAYEAVKQKMSKVVLIAPIAGKVALQLVNVGAQVGEGKPVVKIISSDELLVRFAVPVEQADLVKTGQTIDITVDARGNPINATGTVKSVAPELDQIAQMIFAEATFTRMPAGLQAGNVARIKVPEASKQSLKN